MARFTTAVFIIIIAVILATELASARTLQTNKSGDKSCIDSSKYQMFEGQNVFVSGSSAGIGRGVALAFLQRGAKHVFINGRNSSRLNEAVKYFEEQNCAKYISVIKADMSIPSEVESLFENIEGQLNKQKDILHIVVNNAGILGTVGPAGTFNPKDTWKQDSISAPADALFNNYYSTYHGMNYALRYWLKATKDQPTFANFTGIIVNVASVNGLQGAPGAAAYGASKFAIVGLTKSIALEYSYPNPNLNGFMCRVNAVAPGAVDTDLLRMQFSTKPQLQPYQSYPTHFDAKGYEAFAKASHTMPGGRLETPADVAESVLYLATPARGPHAVHTKYVNGHILSVDAGITAGYMGPN
eukprot:Nk52_evm88s352 gene=Nk52_evmTU88s352